MKDLKREYKIENCVKEIPSIIIQFAKSMCDKYHITSRMRTLYQYIKEAKSIINYFDIHKLLLQKFYAFNIISEK